LSEEFVEELKRNGITSTSDGLLRDFIARGLYTAALNTLPSSIEKRTNEIEYLRRLEAQLHNEVNNVE